jgi:hypothetical protein
VTSSFDGTVKVWGTRDYRSFVILFQQLFVVD